FSLDLSLNVNFSNFDFARDRAVDATSLPPSDLMWSVGASGTQELAEDVFVDFAYRDDPVLRRQFFTRLQYTDEFFRFVFGPFFGLWNAPDTILQSGLSTTVELFVPGLITVALRSDTSLSARLVVPGDYIQEQSELSLGFFVYNAIPRIYLRSKRYTYKTSLGERIDSLTEYGLRTDVFQKNIPYQLILDFGYQRGIKTFMEPTTVTHGFGALTIATEVDASLTDAFTIFASLEGSIYTFGTDFLVGSVNSDQFMFRTTAGARLQL
ncbi:MAG: hypothetical protein ACOC8L_09545, partial [Spirochaetota bacterium]